MSELALARVDLSALSPAERIEAADRTTRALSRLDGIRHAVLQTCERFEVYTSDREDTCAILSDSGFVAVECETGQAAFRHLVRVATGLASRIPGEPHVLGQVRAALASALTSGTASPQLARAFAAAIRCARHVRERSALGEREGGYAARAVSAVSSAFVRPGDAHALVVGSGVTAREVALGLAAASIGRVTIAGRHPPSVDAIAREAGADAVDLSAAIEGRITCDIVVAAVSSRRPLLATSVLRAMGVRLVVDLGAVPNVAPDEDTSDLPILRLENLGDGSRTKAYEIAERLVEREVARYTASRSLVAVRREAARIAS